MNLCVMEKTVIRHYRLNRNSSPDATGPFPGEVRPLRIRMVTIKKVSPDIKAAISLIISTNALALSALFKNIAELF